jgi:RNA processing factor Prp31
MHDYYGFSKKLNEALLSRGVEENVSALDPIVLNLINILPEIHDSLPRLHSNPSETDNIHRVCLFGAAGI